jgi:predicted nuclease of predicted toxin-antitoxin system
MPLRFFFDECVDEDVAAALRAHRVDVETTSGLGRKGLSDEEQLAFAAKESRVIYTIDQDFLRLAYC